MESGLLHQPQSLRASCNVLRNDQQSHHLPNYDERHLQNSLDDILIFTKMEEEHERAVQRVLEVLTEHKLFLHPEKCEFHRKQIEYLGLVISENKVEMDPVKVAGVYDWPTLENQTDVQAFIGFVNFYHHFIWDFSTIARPPL